MSRAPGGGLLDHEIVVVHGKGGVGRTTVTAALGRAAARAGRRTCVVELSGQASLARACGFDQPAYAPREVEPGLWVRSLSPGACMSDFGQRKLRIGALARLFFESRLLRGFTEAVPGLHDVVQLGKVENMLREPLEGELVYDLVLLDAPATGHGLSLLASARAMARMTRVGPFYDLATIIEDFLGDPAVTANLLVTLPELLPVHEALELHGRLDALGTPVDVVVANRVTPPLETGGLTPEALLAHLAGWPRHGRALHRVAHGALARQRVEREALTALDAGLADASAPRWSLPWLDAPRALEPMVAALRDALEAA